MVSELKQVGPRLRAARVAQGLTLDQVAAAAGMSPSTLSRLESGKRQASLELLVPLTAHLGLSVDALIAPHAPDPRVRRPAFERDGIVYVPLAPPGSPVRTYKITYPPATEAPAPKVHSGYEWLYVLSGRLRLLLGEQDLTLTKGEAAEFDTAVPHAMHAVGGRPAQVISIFNQSGVRMHTYGADPSGDLPGSGRDST